MKYGKWISFIAGWFIVFFLSILDSGVPLLVMAICAFVLIGLGGIALLKVPTKFSQTKATDQILKTRAFKDVKAVRAELNTYFCGIVGNLTKANFCFSVAFIILSLTVEGLNPGMSIFEAMSRILPFVLIPILIIMVAKTKVMNLRSYCFDKLSEK